jgi:hypothetical protein
LQWRTLPQGSCSPSDLFIGDPVLGPLPISEGPQNCAPGKIQERDNGRSNGSQGCHGRRHPDGDFLWIAQRDLFRHKLADHQGEVSNDGNDKPDAEQRKQAVEKDQRDDDRQFDVTSSGKVRLRGQSGCAADIVRGSRSSGAFTRLAYRPCH